jgi:hypothetical protein
MVRGILKGGVIYPIEPLPPDWADGREVLVEDAQPESPESVDRWHRELEGLVAGISPEDIRRLSDALAEADRLAKPAVGREIDRL